MYLAKIMYARYLANAEDKEWPEEDIMSFEEFEDKYWNFNSSEEDE